ncbi:VanZ family protein [Pontibacillus salipaludis]|uniref:VanZ family protein n=1 Tax=Pontibacillus salipaludis TaxID=1697394 RepID=A0ABQ1Q286_9BACI|nr:VanZ family protein [Pontibacillus salipaludis]GGD10458.1 VanZ family protein [Pontibacillus salipaludis]
MKRIFYWLYPLSWMGMIFYSSSTPYQEQDVKPFMNDYLDLSFMKPYLDWIVFTYHHQEVSVRNLGVEGFIEFFLRKGAHVTVFLILFFFLYIAISRTTSLTLKGNLLTSLIITGLYAAFDEIHQGFTPNRTPYIGDVGMDLFGALLGVCIILIYKKKKKTPE